MCDFLKQQQSQICIYRKQISKKPKIKSKILQRMSHQILLNERRLKQPFQIEMFQQQSSLDDKCVQSMSKELVISLPQKQLYINMAKKWHLDLSDITDKGIMNLSQGLIKIGKLDQLNLALHGWGYWNAKITDSSLNYITKALILQNNLNEFKLDLNMWAYENLKITDKGAQELMDGISQLRKLGKLELNLKGWGECNQEITDSTVIELSKCLQQLKQLSEIKLILWENIGKQAAKQLNKTLSSMENLTKIEVKYESLKQQPTQQYPKIELKLQQIKLNALQKRKLLFQVEAINLTLNNIIHNRSLWNIALKL